MMFYRALVENEISAHELADHALRNLAIELTVQLRHLEDLLFAKDYNSSAMIF